jgi:diguanylate cyclase (GGDEF)-like protein/PAS domain S-box-containing protein
MTVSLAPDFSDLEWAAALLNIVASNTINGIVVTDAQGYVIWTNAAFSNITGYQLDEVRGKKPGSILQGPDTSQETVQLIRQCLREQYSFNVDIINYNKTGYPYWVNVRAEPFNVATSKGDFYGFIAIQTDIDKEKKTNIRLNANLNFNETVLSTMKDAVLTLTDEGTIRSVNAAVSDIFGYVDHELLGQNICVLFPCDDTQNMRARERYSDTSIEITGKHKDASDIPVLLSISETESYVEKLRILVAHDLRERKAVEASLLGFRRTLDSTLDCVFMFDADTLRFSYVNQGAIDQLGYSKETLLEMKPYMIKPHLSESQFKEMIKPLMLKQKPSLSFETVHRRSDNTDIPVEIFLQYIELDNFAPRFVAIVRDITDKLRQQKEIEYLAYFDSLTTLPNRRYILKEIDKVIARVSVDKEYAAVLLIDMDDFKIINDTLGHSKGDEVLVELTQRFQACLPNNATLARLGGDEFLAVVEHLSEDKAQALAAISDFSKHLLESAKLSVSALSRAAEITSSIGIVLFNDDGYSTSELIRRADIAMYDAKSKGKNIASVYGDAMHNKLIHQQDLLAELRVALTVEDQIICWYQPKVNQDGELCGYEALVRWQHPQKGLLFPGDFIELAEDNNLVCQLGEKVLYQACHTMAQWTKQYALHDCTMAVNISQQQLALADFPQTVKDALAKSGLSASHLQLEVTESALAHDIDSSIKRMLKIRAIGVTFSLDDFGTGYSSLSYLQKLPISEVKIDRSFVMNLLHDSQVQAIVRAVVGLAQDLDLTIVCEGIEEERQWLTLKDMGCTLFQGYLFSRPAPPSDTVSLMLIKR